MEYINVTKWTRLEGLPVSSSRYFIYLTPDAKPSGCEVIRDHSRVRELVAAGEEVTYVISSCGFCGGPTPCLHD